MTELNLSGNAATFDGKKHGEMSGIVALAEVIPDMGALMIFDISDNTLCAEGGKILAEALNGNQVMTELNISSNYLAEDEEDEPDMSGVIALVCAIPGMGALTSLNLSSNFLQDEGAKIVAEAIKVTTNCAIAFVMAPFSCRFDLSFN
jgi:Ran GTPase-activating protein (RanGAP) involved in mRNA processing and transport